MRGFRTGLEGCPSWPKEHDWKSCIRQKRIRGSNPRPSAICWFDHTSRRGGRAVECGGLENRFTGQPGNQGSNPCLSARTDQRPSNGAFSFLARSQPRRQGFEPRQTPAQQNEVSFGSLLALKIAHKLNYFALHLPWCKKVRLSGALKSASRCTTWENDVDPFSKMRIIAQNP